MDGKWRPAILQGIFYVQASSFFLSHTSLFKAPTFSFLESSAIYTINITCEGYECANYFYVMDTRTTIPETSPAAAYQPKDPHGTNALRCVACMKGDLMHAVECCVVRHEVNQVGGEPGVGDFDEVRGGGHLEEAHIIVGVHRVG
jgi:hypothetical protein